MKIIYISIIDVDAIHNACTKTKLNLLVGTYTTKCVKGIYVYDFDAKTADFKYKNATSAVINPSYLTVAKENNFVYSVNENGKKCC
jgi:6-phosphogluconolactonase